MFPWMQPQGERMPLPIRVPEPPQMPNFGSFFGGHAPPGIGGMLPFGMPTLPISGLRFPAPWGTSDSGQRRQSFSLSVPWTPRQQTSSQPAVNDAAPSPYTPTAAPTGGGDIEQAIDELTAGDQRLAMAMKMAVYMESGGRADAVGDNGQSHGFYQIYQAAHGKNITPEQSRDPYASTRYMLPAFQSAIKRVPVELWTSNPRQAAALTAFYAERPAKMYSDGQQSGAWSRLQSPRRSEAHTFSEGEGEWGYLVPGGRGKVEHGGTHGGHPAADIFAPEGTPILAPVDGISSPGTYELGGNATTIRGADGRYYYMAHGKTPFVAGQVRKGQIIGYVGRTGNARNTAAHLHYAVASNASIFGQRNGSGDLDPRAR